jgi:hypothetical protein
MFKVTLPFDELRTERKELQKKISSGGKETDITVSG